MIIATKLLGEMTGLKGDELAGAEKLMLSFLDALLGEINIAHSVLRLRNFEEARMKILKAAERIRLHEHLEATSCISQAISFTTTSGQQAAQTLKQKGLL